MRRLIHGFRQTSISPIVLEPCIQQRLAVLYNPSESSSHPPSNPNQLPRHPLCHTCHLDPPRFNLALIAPPHLRSTSKSSGKNAHTMSPWWLSMCMCASCPHNAPCDPFVALHPQSGRCGTVILPVCSPSFPLLLLVRHFVLLLEVVWSCSARWSL